MTEAERVLAEVAVLFRPTGGIVNVIRVRELLEPHLPKPEPDRLTVAAGECFDVTYNRRGSPAALEAVRAIIAHEVAAAEPSDEALWRVVRAANNGGSTGAIRAALKGEGA